MLLVPLVAPLAATALSASAAPSGRSVEARTASVFAGACHYNGERVTAGREAVIAWSIERGCHAGVDLAGAHLVLVVRDDVNLVEEPRARRAVLFLDPLESAARRAALAAWVRTRVPALLDAGHVEVVVDASTPVDVDVIDDAYAVRVGERVALNGSALPDRACCKMPYLVWYEPFQPLRDALVGCDREFEVALPAHDVVFSRPDENAAIFGAFGASRGSSARVASAPLAVTDLERGAR